MQIPTLVLDVDFHDHTAQDQSGFQNHGSLTLPSFHTGSDGACALLLENSFGPAQHHLQFSSLQGIDLSRDSFTLIFWMQSQYGGSFEWTDKDHKAPRGIGIDLNKALRGGVLCANMAWGNTDSGFGILLLPQFAYMTCGVRCQNQDRCVEGIQPPQDCRWHQIALVIDREGDGCIYVDAANMGRFPLSDLSSIPLGSNSLSFGADSLGNYGIGATSFQHIRLYKGLLSEDALQKSFMQGQMRRLLHETSMKLREAGSPYSADAKTAFAAAISEAKKDPENAESYHQLRRAYEKFLESPQKNAKLTAILLGDPHIGEPGDRCAQNLEIMVSDIIRCGISADVMIGVGDNGNRSDYRSGHNAFAVIDALMASYQLPWQLISCHGNHDTMYDSETANYFEGVRAYEEGISRHLLPDSPFRRPGTTLDQRLRDVAAQYLGADAGNAGCSYGVTVNGCHFLVLNTDYLPQTGCSKNCRDENGNWSIDGNALDPIRHGMHLYDGTFTWIRHMLDRYADGNPVFVICHFPFADTVALSYYRDIVIEDNSIGKQDARIRALLSEYDHVFYICGHLHSGLGLSKPAMVTSSVTGRSFPEIVLSSMNTITRGYCSLPSGWILFLYEDQIILRARDHRTGMWLPEYDEVIPFPQLSSSAKSEAH